MAPGMRTAIAIVALTAALALAACGGDGGSSASTTSNGQTGKVRDVGLVPAYCLYRSDTKAQMIACEAQTEAADVQSTDGEAARWARGELRDCGKTAGELCRYYRGVP